MGVSCGEARSLSSARRGRHPAEARKAVRRGAPPPGGLGML